MSLSVDLSLMDLAVRHQLYLTRLMTHEANAVSALLDEVNEDLTRQIEARLARIRRKGFDPGPVTTRRLRDMQASIRETSRELFAGVQEHLEGSLVGLAQQEAQWAAGSLAQSIPITVDPNVVSLPALRAVVTAQPIVGRPLAEWVETLAESQERGLMQAIRLGIAEDETVEQIARRIRGTRAMGYRDGIIGPGEGRAAQTQINRQARAVVRTACNHVSTHARDATYWANRDLLSGIRIVATLDSRTTPRCQREDGKVYPVGDGPRPPFHVGCRTTTVPETKTNKELGIDLPEAPAGQRASADGPVPANWTYGQWLRRQKAAVQDEALGKTRGALFRRGGLDISKFTDRRGRQFTLAELRRRESDVFEAVGV